MLSYGASSRNPGKGACAEGHTGPLCAACRFGWTRDTSEQACANGSLNMSGQSGWRPQKTPGVKKADVEDRVPLNAASAKGYRGLTALSNYMALDRCDIGFASKEVSKSMST